jgi:hypothetical protein
MVMIGIIVGAVFFIVVILCVRLKQGCFFEPMFSDDFPEELKLYIKKWPMRYRARMIAPFLERYEEAKKREGNFFSLERFFGEEKLMRIKRNRR